jgi:hypothetical protein
VLIKAVPISARWGRKSSFTSAPTEQINKQTDGSEGRNQDTDKLADTYIADTSPEHLGATLMLFK